MKILVPTKRVPDPDQPIHLNAAKTAADLDGIPCVINPFDAIAIEEALRIREEGRSPAGDDVEIIAVGIGPQDCEKEIRTALAMGADRAIHVVTDEYIDSWVVSNLLKAVTEKEQPDLILMGKQAIDGDNNQAGQFLAHHLGWPQATFASEIVFDGDCVKVARETDTGIENISLELPAIITTDLRLNEPRYASLPAMMKAKRRPLEALTPADLGVAVEPKVEILSMETLSAKRNCIRVNNVEELVAKLKEAGAL
jgi:electron transfer flavoprotein beta subunit